MLWLDPLDLAPRVRRTSARTDRGKRWLLVGNMKIDHRTDQLRAKAERFRSLHNGPRMLVLANAWDVISARLFEAEGFAAIGTSSAGIAATLGYPDGERMSLQENLEVVRRIAAKVKTPVSADLEGGYDRSLEGAVRAALATIEAGAVGVNIEDGTQDSEKPICEVNFQAERIVAMRQAATGTGVPLVINARTDVFMVSGVSRSWRIDESVRRGNAYRRAGADCVFVPDMGDLDREAIAEMVAQIDAPLNVLAGGKMPPLPELEALGVGRVSLGPRAMRAGLGVLRRIARELRTSGTYENMNHDTLSYAEVNAMLSD